MRLVSFISTWALVALLGFSQKTELLKPASFSGDQIDQEWVYVKLKPNQVRNQALERLTIQKQSSIGNIVKLRVPKGKDPITFCNELRLSKKYQYADPILAYQLLSTPNDPLIANQYYLSIVKAFQAWDITTGDDDITIGIIDSGLDIDHEDLVDNLWVNIADTIDGVDNDNNGYIDDYFGYDFADLDPDPNIENGNHGMIVGGIAGSRTNNGKGIAGIGYNTKIAALKGFKSSDNTSNGLYEAIIYAADNGIDIVNLSWGRMGEPLASEQEIIDYAVLEKNMVIVAAGGNQGGKETEENKWYPASYDHVLAVAATDANDNKWSGSSFNYAIDIIAPGVDMFSTVVNDGYTDGGPGTSYAAPLVAGAAALVKDQFPNLSALQIMERIRATADDIYDVGGNTAYDGKLGKGRLNIFKALTATNVKSLRVANSQTSTSFGDFIFFGDTVTITADLANLLAASTNPEVYISSPDNNFSVIESSEEIGFLASMDSSDISFKIVLSDGIAPNSIVPIRLDFADGTYNDFQFLEIATEPDYFDLGNSSMSMTISGNGNVGFNAYGSGSEGAGVIYKSDTVMKYVGLMVASSLERVSDNIINDYQAKTRDQDFEVIENYKLFHHQGAEKFGYSVFSDSLHQLDIEQSSLAWEDQDFIISRYRIINKTDSAINDLSFGIFADWNLGDQFSNYATIDSVANYAYVRSSELDLFAGVKILGNGTSLYNALDLSEANGNTADLQIDFSDTTKYDFLVNESLEDAGSAGAGNDVGTISGLTIAQLDSSSFAYIDVIYAIAPSKADLDTLFSIARERLDTFLLKPRLLETFFTCDNSYVIDPTEGVDYEFYSDPLGQNLIAVGSELNISGLASDTTYFVRNIDGNYPTEIFEIRLNQFLEIAGFEMSTDTLYLDHPTTNVVSFTDLSDDAITWSWDFGQGTSSSIQNPSLSFTEPGDYEIRLTVENEQGCSDSFSQTLVVANRPSPPDLNDTTICPGENVTFNDPTAEKLLLFAFEDQLSPSASGETVTLSDISHDTTVFVSGVYGSFESKKTSVFIDVLEVEGTIAIIPDTVAQELRMLLTAHGLETGSSVQWMVNGEDVGSSSSVSVPAIGTIISELTILGDNGCTRTVTKSITVSTSSLPTHPDLISCNNDSVLISPENGTYFGFYEDPELATLIKKGTRLRTHGFSSVYVAGLDDGLPSMPIQVTITDQTPEVSINYNVSPIGSKQKVALTLDSNFPMVSYRWYLDGKFVEAAATPTIFLDDSEYVITVDATTADGCSARDTLNLDLVPPLSTVEDGGLFLYPNPSQGIILLESENVDKIEVYQLDGKMIITPSISNNRIDLTSLKRGIYLVKVYTTEATISQHILLE